MKPDACSCPRDIGGGAVAVDPECPRHGWMCEDGRTLTGPQLTALRLLLDYGGVAPLGGLHELSGMTTTEFAALAGLGWVSHNNHAGWVTAAGRIALARFGRGRIV